MKCPRCRAPLAPARHNAGGIALDLERCGECTGSWVEGNDLKAIEQVVDVRLIEWRHLPGDETQERILFCPRCPGAKPMEKILSPRDDRVVMDTCTECNGVWLDYGELEAIQQKGLLAALADVFAFVRRT